MFSETDTIKRYRRGSLIPSRSKDSFLCTEEIPESKLIQFGNVLLE